MDDTRRASFPRQHRLLTASAFARVFDKANKSRDRWFTVLSRDNDLSVARLGLAISRRHCKKATDRNRLKRIVRESFRTNGRILEGLDIVVMNQPAAATAANRELFSSLDGHWRRCAEFARQADPADG